MLVAWWGGVEELWGPLSYSDDGLVIYGACPTVHSLQ